MYHVGGKVNCCDGAAAADKELSQDGDSLYVSGANMDRMDLNEQEGMVA